MKGFLLLILLVIKTNLSFAQAGDWERKLAIPSKSEDTTEGWQRGGLMGLNIAQTSLTNWSGGGQNSLSINSFLSAYANLRKGKNFWDNTLDLGYGVQRQGKKADFIKTDDKIDVLSKYGYKAFDGWNYAAVVNFKTQMTPGYNYPNDTVKISDFMAPAYVLGAIGMDYKPSNYFSLFLAPLTMKMTIVNSSFLADAGAFGVDPAQFDGIGNMIRRGEKIRTEWGGYLRMMYSRKDFKAEILKNISVTTKLDLFSNYQNNPQNIDVSWETFITLKVNKFISVNLNTHLLYDDDISIPVDTNGDGVEDHSGPRVQFKEILGVGLSYKF